MPVARGDWSEGWYKQRLAKRAADLRRAQVTTSKVRASLEFYAPEGTPKVDLETLKPIVAADVPRETAEPKGLVARQFLALCEQEGLPRPVPELQFHPGRRWRFDFAWPSKLLAVEVDGGVFSGGRHTRGAGFIEDQRKLNAAAVLGWRVLRVTPDRLHEACADALAIFRGG